MGSFGDKFWDWTAKISPPQQTTIDDAHSRLARREQLERTRMTRVETDDDTGRPLLWFTVTVSSLGGHANVPVPWQGFDEEDVRASFIEWLGQDEFQTVDFTSDGKNARLTFRGSWVAGFILDGKGRARP